MLTDSSARDFPHSTAHNFGLPLSWRDRLVHGDIMEWQRRGAGCGALACSAVGLMLVLPVLLLYFAVVVVVSFVALPIGLCCTKRARRHPIAWYFKPSLRLLHLGPWGVHFDSTSCDAALVVVTPPAHCGVARTALWMPWWKVCCRRTVASYVAGGRLLPVAANEAVAPKPAGHVRLVVVSDTHAKMSLAAVPPGDVLVHCGDILARNGKLRCVRPAQLLRQFDAELARFPHPHKVIIGGNHDAVRTLLHACAHTTVTG